MRRLLMITIGLMITLFAAQAFAQLGGSWEGRAPIPTARVSAVAATIGSKLYVVGGYTPAVGDLPSVVEYNPATDTWTPRAPPFSQNWIWIGQHCDISGQGGDMS